jgi:hypothetical protein
VPVRPTATNDAARQAAVNFRIISSLPPVDESLERNRKAVAAVRRSPAAFQSKGVELFFAART